MIDYQPYHKALSDLDELVKKYWPEFHLHFKYLDSKVRTVQDIENIDKLRDHPSYQDYRALVRDTKSSILSDYLGIKKTKRRISLSGKKKSVIKIFVLLQPVHFATDKQILPAKDYEIYLYRMLFALWHAIDLAQNVFYDQTYQEIDNNLVISQRSRLETARQNLKADIFATLVLRTMGYENTDKNIAYCYAWKSLQTINLSYPELYPFLMGYDLTLEAYKEFNEDLSSTNDLIGDSIEITNNIADILGTKSLTIWQKYCLSAQTLAWCGTSSEHILASAIDLCNIPEIRMCAYSVAELLDIDVPRLQKSETDYNSFTSEKQQLQAHKKAVSLSFDKCIEQALQAGQGSPFFEEADRQNEELAKGNFFGWCAPSLQAAGHYINNGSFQGELPKEITRMHFEGSEKDYKITEIRQLARILMNERRKGNKINLVRLYRFLKNKNINKVVKNSVKQSLIHKGLYESEDQDKGESEVMNYWKAHGKDFGDINVHAIAKSK